MSLLADLKVLYHLTLKPLRGKTHQERLENFYSGQAEAYDSFRQRLLHGRRELYDSVPAPADGVWVDLGGGTGAGIDFLGEKVSSLKSFYVVDLSPSLLEVARRRASRAGLDNVHTVCEDVTRFVPAEGHADVVTFSYSLTMIPDWFSAVEQAGQILRPGGILGVVDFYVSRKFPAEGRGRHGWLSRTFWPAWFAADNVFPSPDHLPFLEQHLETIEVREMTGSAPWLPGLKIPYYRYLGRKPGVPA